MLRKLMAFVAYNVYAVFLVGAFELDVPYILDHAKVDEMRARGLIFQMNSWGWNDHYIYRLFAAIVATGGAAFIAGAILSGHRRQKSQSNSLTFSMTTEMPAGADVFSGARTEADMEPAVTEQGAGWFMIIANLPSVIVWALMFYMMTDGHLLADPSNRARSYFKWMCLLAIPLTSVVAFLAGREGARFQNEEFHDRTTLGISPFHWTWALIPVYIYSISVIAAGARFAQNIWHGWSQEGLLGTILYFLTLIPLIAYFYPLKLSYQILSREKMAAQRNVLRAAAVVGVLTVGLVLAVAIDAGSAFGLAALGYAGDDTNRTPDQSYVVNTSEKWCEVVSGEDLAKKNNASQLEYDVAAIRVDFIEKLNRDLIDRLKEDSPKEQGVDDKSIQKLVDEKKFGAWQEQDASGIHLHVADDYPSADGSNENQTFDRWVKDYQDGLKKDRGNAENSKEPIQCFFRMMDNLFDELILRSGSRQVAVPLRHTARDYETKKK